MDCRHTSHNGTIHRPDSRLAPSQWETSLPSNAVSLWLGTNLESSLYTASKALPTQQPLSSRWCHTVPIHWSTDFTIQHSAVITQSISSKILTKALHSSPVRARYQATVLKADTAKLTSPRTFADKRWVGSVKLLCMIMFNISKIRPKSLLGPVKDQKFLRCLYK